jgi:hypothetical protein
MKINKKYLFNLFISGGISLAPRNVLLLKVSDLILSGVNLGELI